MRCTVFFSAAKGHVHSGMELRALQCFGQTSPAQAVMEAVSATFHADKPDFAALVVLRLCRV